ncbi:replication factor C subunit 5-like [Centruroides sculpturatus]|uniref:replication factor C subunit 5-like n=1 Tax=Centruroides sculpturatus TaxID=218467 RepID=UPI000C6D9476|nr:replication factor C subunit 5-like [Centruroides sculpturatus]
MTQQLTHLLQGIIEKFTDNTRFCIICNYLSKIIPAVQSRCTRFRFGPLSPKQIEPRLNYIVEKEKINITDDGKTALMELSQGDMRKVINILQSTAMAFDIVNEENVYTCVGHPLKSDIKNIVTWLLNDDFVTAYENINKLKTLKGLALQDILNQVHLYIHRIEFSPNVKIYLLDKMADIE